MPEIIADTSALIAFFIRSEAHHEAARRYMAEQPKHALGHPGIGL